MVGGNEGRIAMLVRAYLDAEYRWEQAGEWHHLRIGEPAPAIDAAFPGVASFGLLSAWNPRSVPRPEADNRAADESLHGTLLASRVACRPAFASARDRSWREPSWLVAGMAVPVFDALACRFAQLGSLWWQRGEGVRLRMYAPAIVTANTLDHIDWIEPGRHGADG